MRYPLPNRHLCYSHLYTKPVVVEVNYLSIRKIFLVTQKLVGILEAAAIKVDSTELLLLLLLFLLLLLLSLSSSVVVVEVVTVMVVVVTAAV